MNFSSECIAGLLLKSKAVTIDVQKPYTYSSGIRSPIYCDHRLLISDVSARTKVVDAFCELIKPFHPKQIAGVATAGITWGAWIADRLELPYVYVRPKPKEHGKGKQIEGSLVKAQTILIEDLLSTGGSSVQVLEVLRSQCVDVVALMSIFTYGFASSKQLFQEKQIQVHTLTSLEVLLNEGVKLKLFDQEIKSEVLRWRSNPEKWFQK